LGGLVVSGDLFSGGDNNMVRWFVPPVVVPAGLVLLLVAIMLYRQFSGV
jgi:hypothetical protein